MGGLVEGAALGVAFEMLFMSIFDSTQKLVHFRSHINRLKSTLSFIKLTMGEDVHNFQRIKARPAHENQSMSTQLLKAEKLIRRCEKVKWNVFKRLHYAKKLRKLDAALVRFFQIEVAAAIRFRENKRMCGLEGKINELITLLNRSEKVKADS